MTAQQRERAALDVWCDARRNAATITTLGMIQERIAKLLEGR